MKKLLTLAAMALMAFSAQAVTLDWDNYGWTVKSGTIGTGGWNASFDNPDGDFAVRVTYVGTLKESFTTNNNGKAWARFFTLKANNSDWARISYKYTNSGGTVSDAIYGEGGSDDPTDKLAGTISGYAGQDVNLTFTFEYDSTSDVLSFFVQDNKALTPTQTLLHTYDLDQNVADTIEVGGGTGLDFSTGGAQDLTSIFDSGTYTVEAVAPEPTALALLALGVAGVALRRKVK